MLRSEVRGKLERLAFFPRPHPVSSVEIFFVSSFWSLGLSLPHSQQLWCPQISPLQSRTYGQIMWLQEKPLPHTWKENWNALRSVLSMHTTRRALAILFSLLPGAAAVTVRCPQLGLHVNPGSYSYNLILMKILLVLLCALPPSAFTSWSSSSLPSFSLPSSLWNAVCQCKLGFNSCITERRWEMSQDLILYSRHWPFLI